MHFETFIHYPSSFWWILSTPAAVLLLHFCAFKNINWLIVQFFFFVSTSENAAIDCCQLDNHNIISIKVLSRYHFDSAVFARSAAEPEKEVAVATVCRSTWFAEKNGVPQFWSFSTEQLDSLKPLGCEEHMQEGV